MDQIANAYILFCALCNPQEHKIISFDLLVSWNVDLVQMPDFATYKDIINKINKTKVFGSFSQTSTNSLRVAFSEKIKQENYLIELLHYVQHNDTEKAQSLLSEVLQVSLGITEPEIHVHIFSVVEEEIEVISIEESTSSDSGESSPEKQVQIKIKIPEVPITAGAIIGKFQFVLSPVSGKRMDELKAGDRIMVKLSTFDTPSRNIINLLTLRDRNGDIKNVPATLTFAELTDNGLEFVAKITDGIFVKYIEQEEASIKVKLAGDETLSTTIERIDILENFEQVKTENHFSLLNWTVLILIVLILLWVVAVFFVL